MANEYNGSLLAAIGRNAPISDVPVKRSNPFEFSGLTFSELQNLFLWNKLLFDPVLLPGNPYFSSDSNLYPSADLFRHQPMNPTEGVPILPPQFRRAVTAWRRKNALLAGL